ncbi:MAG TPA: VOC family protein [Polyangiaceae bacterium]|nr:VOC family protein [Polyangiaceae bacterium]
MSNIVLSAITLHTEEPARLADFYRKVLELPLDLNQHGTLGSHFEGTRGGVHFAIWKASTRVGGPVVPVFRVPNLERELERVRSLGVVELHRPLDLGEGKRVVTLEDSDHNAFRLIEIS